jgi:hypothetical protein
VSGARDSDRTNLKILSTSGPLLLTATLLASWLGMQQIHELGHVLGAWLTGGQVERVVLHPLSFSRTDLALNPQPLVVAWAGPVFGVALPFIAWLVAAKVRMPGAFVLRFFAGFCLLANGAYLGIGSFDRIGDCGDLLRHGARMWQLWLFGAVTAPAGLWLWHGLGASFGIGPSAKEVSRGVTVAVCVACLLLLAIAFLGQQGVAVPA